jgi:hypothetical protein
VYGVYIFLYKSSLKFDHYYFITDGSLCLLYSIHSSATINMSMVWLNFDLSVPWCHGEAFCFWPVLLSQKFVSTTHPTNTNTNIFIHYYTGQEDRPKTNFLHHDTTGQKDRPKTNFLPNDTTEQYKIIKIQTKQYQCLT